ncbi:MAG: lipid-A-disaccharide synthase-related protein [Microcystaceae cyanobacterium]
MSSAKRILFISNGHGEDNHSSYIVETLLELRPDLEIAAMPIIGEGNAYRRLNIPIIGPTQSMPSGGFSYMDRLKLIKDIQSGLITLTWRQLRAVLDYAPQCDLIMATGDTISQSFAYLTRRPFVSFISCLSALYEGSLYLGPIIGNVLRSPRCLAVFTRDPYTAEDLWKQGLNKAKFGGITSLDKLTPTGKGLQLKSNIPMIALLPGSRLPEAIRNFKLQLQWTQEIIKVMGENQVQFRAALVPKVMDQLTEIAQAIGWKLDQNKLISPNPNVEVICYSDAFNDILHQTTLVLGMAGLAVDQAVALGKPVIQVPGEGPQFTYAFAEAQTRLLGISAQTIGKKPATLETLKEAAIAVQKTLNDPEYLDKCAKNGQERLGTSGASFRIAEILLSALDNQPIS